MGRLWGDRSPMGLLVRALQVLLALVVLPRSSSQQPNPSSQPIPESPQAIPESQPIPDSAPENPFDEIHEGNDFVYNDETENAFVEFEVGNDEVHNINLPRNPENSSHEWKRNWVDLGQRRNELDVLDAKVKKPTKELGS
nr:hypothetical protein Iba_chr14cCG7360 [Ipomoea batatas]